MWVWAALAIGQAVWSAIAQHNQGAAVKRAANSQADVNELQAKQDEYNATIASGQATDATQRGLESEARFRDQVRGLIGTQRSGYAAQGVVVDNGSAADAQRDAQTLGDADVRTIRANAQREAWGYRVQSENYLKDAEIARKGGAILRREGDNAQRAANIGAASTLVGASSSLLLQRYGWREPSATRSPTGSSTYPGTPPFVGDAMPGYRNAA